MRQRGCVRSSTRCCVECQSVAMERQAATGITDVHWSCRGPPSMLHRANREETRHGFLRTPPVPRAPRQDERVGEDHGGGDHPLPDLQGHGDLRQLPRRDRRILPISGCAASTARPSARRSTRRSTRPTTGRPRLRRACPSAWTARRCTSSASSRRRSRRCSRSGVRPGTPATSGRWWSCRCTAARRSAALRHPRPRGPDSVRTGTAHWAGRSSSGTPRSLRSGADRPVRSHVQQMPLVIRRAILGANSAVSRSATTRSISMSRLSQ